MSAGIFATDQGKKALVWKKIKGTTTTATWADAAGALADQTAWLWLKLSKVIVSGWLSQDGTYATERHGWCGRSRWGEWW